VDRGAITGVALSPEYVTTIQPGILFPGDLRPGTALRARRRWDASFTFPLGEEARGDKGIAEKDRTHHWAPVSDIIAWVPGSHSSPQSRIASRTGPSERPFSVSR